jgi:hypothetical protein
MRDLLKRLGRRFVRSGGDAKGSNGNQAYFSAASCTQAGAYPAPKPAHAPGPYVRVAARSTVGQSPGGMVDMYRGNQPAPNKAGWVQH